MQRLAICSPLVFDLQQVESSLKNWIEPVLSCDDTKTGAHSAAVDAIARIARIRGRIEQLETENERLNQLLAKYIRHTDYVEQ